jgi:hypothetical protein
MLAPLIVQQPIVAWQTVHFLSVVKWRELMFYLQVHRFCYAKSWNHLDAWEIRDLQKWPHCSILSHLKCVVFSQINCEGAWLFIHQLSNQVLFLTLSRKYSKNTRVLWQIFDFYSSLLQVTTFYFWHCTYTIFASVGIPSEWVEVFSATIPKKNFHCSHHLSSHLSQIGFMFFVCSCLADVIILVATVKKLKTVFCNTSIIFFAHDVQMLSFPCLQCHPFLCV